jgi:aminopeptidase N
VLNQLVYQKGGWTLHMLRRQIGTEKYWAGVRDYYHRYRDGNASTEDFRKVMEENSGTDLGWFFEQWLNRAGSPLVEGSWRYDAGAKKIAIQLAQKQPGEAFRLPLEVGISERIEMIEMTRKEQQFEIASDQEPTSVVLDPNTWVLMDAKFSK